MTFQIMHLLTHNLEYLYLEKKLKEKIKQKLKKI